MLLKYCYSECPEKQVSWSKVEGWIAYLVYWCQVASISSIPFRFTVTSNSVQNNSVELVVFPNEVDSSAVKRSLISFSKGSFFFENFGGPTLKCLEGVIYILVVNLGRSSTRICRWPPRLFAPVFKWDLLLSIDEIRIQYLMSFPAVGRVTFQKVSSRVLIIHVLLKMKTFINLCLLSSNSFMPNFTRVACAFVRSSNHCKDKHMPFENAVHYFLRTTIERKFETHTVRLRGWLLKSSTAVFDEISSQNRITKWAKGN